MGIVNNKDPFDSKYTQWKVERKRDFNEIFFQNVCSCKVKQARRSGTHTVCRTKMLKSNQFLSYISQKSITENASRVLCSYTHMQKPEG